MSRVSARKYARLFAEGDAETLFASRKTIGCRLAENEQVRKAVFNFFMSRLRQSALTEPPGGWLT
jgi:hypothetical protein